jgi:phage terminase large subunit
MDARDLFTSMIDFRNPQYLPVWKVRFERLQKLRADPLQLAAVKVYYRTHIADFINDWGVTVDPRVAARGRRAIMPMCLWPKQREWIDFLYERWINSEPGTTVKSRDVGISWLAMGFSISMCVFRDGISIGFGSEKEDKIDRSGDPDCLFYKGRLFLQYLPAEFRAGYDIKKYSAHMRLTFPLTGGSITGEAGDNIGRGGRKAIYFIDESAHVPNPKAIDLSLSGNTDCRQDMSSVFGMNNGFAERAHNGSIKRFDFHWKDDPRKDAAWEAKKRAELDPVVFAAEYDCNFTASVEGVVIPAIWVTAAVDAHKRLGLQATGIRRGTLDVADAGRDANAFGVSRSFLVERVESWRGTEDLDIYHSVERSFMLCDQYGLDGFDYDADGLGAGVRGDARKVNEARQASGSKWLQVMPFRGSGEVFNPEVIVPGTERTAEDFFENMKAQAWWTLRQLFQYTYRIMERLKTGEPAAALAAEVDPSKFISIAADFEKRARLCVELSQPIWGLSKRGKMMVDKCPVGTKTEVRNAITSPNLADAVMMLYAPRAGVIAIHPGILAATAASHNIPRGAFR